MSLVSTALVLANELSDAEKEAHKHPAPNIQPGTSELVQEKSNEDSVEVELSELERLELQNRNSNVESQQSLNEAQKSPTQASDIESASPLLENL